MPRAGLLQAALIGLTIRPLHRADLLLDWIPDAGLRTRVLVENPARLYGFPP